MIKPAGHRVLVRPLSLEKSTKTGILLAHDERKEKAQIRGTILAIGPTAWKAFDEGEPWAKVGDTIFYAQYGGYLVRDPETDEELRLLNDEDVCAVTSHE